MKKYVEENKENMLKDLSILVEVPSVYSDDVKPFGSANREVLDRALKLMDDKGFKTRNLDYYCGYGEVGEGEQVIGILAHLDVVPAGDGWDSDPFVMTRKGNIVYGRGVTDNKSAAVSCMYALKYLKDTGYPFKKRVRLILGCNEESGSACIRHYVQEEGHIDMGFTPDGDFPGVYGEKGMKGGTIIGHDSKIIDIKGGDVSNAVAKNVYCVVENNSFDKDVLIAFLTENGLQVTIEEKENTKITVVGKSAHASTPEKGVNAISYLMVGLSKAGYEDSFVSFYNRFIGLEVHGETLGFESIKDDLTDTTLNIGLIWKQDGDIVATVDMRFPVKATVAQVDALLTVLHDEKNEFIGKPGVEPLYFDADSPFVQAMYRAYQDVTGDKEAKLEVMGGGTYAKTIHNCIAFGNGFHTGSSRIHDANENLRIDLFLLETMIYIEAIKNLNEV